MYQLAFSTETIDELRDVLFLPKIRDRHGWSDEEIDEYLIFLVVNSVIYEVDRIVVPSLVRDITDTKFLALAQESRSDYLVTNDRRHLLPLRQFGETRIVTPAVFLRGLD